MSQRPLLHALVLVAAQAFACSGDASSTTGTPSATTAKSSAPTKPGTAAPNSATATASAKSPVFSGSPSAAPSGSAAAGGAERPVGAFTKLKIGTSLEADIEIGAATPLSLSGDAADLAEVVTKVEGDTLVVELTPGSHDLKTAVKVKFSVPSLVGISASTASEVNVKGLACESLSADAETSAKVKLAGKCKSFTASAKTSGEIDAKGLEVETAKVEAATSGEISVNATASVTGTSSTGAEVHVSGNPKEKKVETATGGEVD